MLQLPTITSLTEVEKLENLGVIIEFTPEEEEISPDYEEEENQAIADKYNSGNMAAWFWAERIQENPKKYEKFKIQRNAASNDK